MKILISFLLTCVLILLVAGLVVLIIWFPYAQHLLMILAVVLFLALLTKAIYSILYE